METIPESYVWEVPGKPVKVLIDFDTLDRLSREIMRGFGMVPRRSVEVGGILLGSVERSADGRQWSVRIEDFEPVPCRHLQGMAYLLSAEEEKRFEDTLEQWRAERGGRTYAVGFYRSHAREGLGLTAEDLEIYGKHFPDPSSIVLLVKPFATRASVGAFFFREDGEVRSESSYQEFPFRRRELGGEPPEERDEAEAQPELPPVFEAARTTARERARFSDDGLVSEPRLDGGMTDSKKMKRSWMWIPLSFIFLLLGTMLGFYVAMNLRSQSSTRDPYSLNLSVTPSGASVYVRWDPAAPAVLASTHGALTITDGGLGKTVELKGSDLRRGNILYNRASQDLTFRLEVFARDRVAVSESLSVQMDAAQGEAAAEK